MQLKDEYDDDDEEDIGKVVSSSKPKSKILHNSAVDITADELVPLLSPENVANLVLLSMVSKRLIINAKLFLYCGGTFSKLFC